MQRSAQTTWHLDGLGGGEDMSSNGRNDLPAWLPEWQDATAVMAQLDIGTLRRDVDSLVNLVLAEDTRFLDSLPAAVESAIVTPLLLLERINSDGTDALELVVAARLLRRSMNDVIDECPPELSSRLQKLPL
jgi:hypothetical protein